MKYNAIENAENFIKDQIEWARANRYGNFTIWSNGKELTAKIDTGDFVDRMRNGELKTNGFWKAIIFENGYRVEI